MRKVLLTSVAVAALAGFTAANAQTGPDARKDQPPAASSQQLPGKAGARDEKAKGQPSSQRMDDKASKSSQSSQSSDRQTSGAAGKQGAEGKPQGAQKSQGAQKEDRAQGAQKSGSSTDMKKQQTTGSSPQGGQGSPAAQQSEPKSKQKSTSQSQPPTSTQKPNERSTTGQSPSSSSMQKSNERSTTGQSPSGSQTNRANQPGAAQTQGQSGQTAAPSGTSAGQAGSRQGTTGSTSSSVSLTSDQQTRITDVISKQRVQPVTNVNVSLSVGAPVPRSVRVYDLPRDVVEIYPQFRGHKFTVVRDEIVIIEPRSKKVVAVIPRSGRSTTGTSTSRTSTTLHLSPDKRRIIKETVIREQAAPRCSDVRVSIGEQVSRTIQVHAFSEDIIREVPEIRSYQFCLRDNEVVLIDPREYRIVEVID